MRIGLLLCGSLPDEYAAIAGNFTEIFSALLDGCDITLIPYDAFEGRLPDDANECDGYVISGSKSSVYEDEQWIRDLEVFIREAVDTSVPIFGVCFGLQVMAKALGGTVEKFEGGWGAGVHTMVVDEERPWMTQSGDSVSLIMSHQDQVTALPGAATVLGSSSHCENYLVEFTPRHVGIQGHPEFGRSFAERIYRDQRSKLGSLADEAIDSLSRPLDAQTVANWMCEVLSSGR